MASKDLLMGSETLVLVTRPHWRFIIAGSVVAVVTIICWVLWVQLWGSWLGSSASIAQWIGSLIALIVLLRYTARPIFQWLFTRYYFTSKRVMVRSGVISRHASDIPVNKISNIEYRQSVLDRLLRAGTLEIDSSGGDGFPIDNVPNVERITRMLHELVDAAEKS